MDNFLVTVIGGLTVLVLASWFGIGKEKNARITPASFKVKKTGKWIIIISTALIITGVVLLFGDPGQSSGFNLHSTRASIGFLMTIFGLIFLAIGKVVEWFQKN